MLQEVRTSVVVKVVESIAVHGAHQPQGSSVRDAPPFVAKAVQDQLAATCKLLLQQFALRTIAPAEEAVRAAFSDQAFLHIDAAQVGPPRPWVRLACQALLDTATEASALLPAGDPLPAALVRAPSSPVCSCARGHRCSLPQSCGAVLAPCRSMAASASAVLAHRSASAFRTLLRRHETACDCRLSVQCSHRLRTALLFDMPDGRAWCISISFLTRPPVGRISCKWLPCRHPRR